MSALGILQCDEPGPVTEASRWDDPSATVAPIHGFSYRCPLCDVSGAIAAGEIVRCWCCRSTKVEAR